MGSITGRKFAGLALIIGPPLYIVAELLKRQSPVNSGLDQLLTNPNLSHVMAQLSILGLLATLFGLYTFWRATQDDTPAASFIRFGLVALTVGITGFVFTNGLDHIAIHNLTHEDTSRAEIFEARAHAAATVRTGIVVVSGITDSFGTALLALGLGMAFQSGFQRNAARVMMVVGFIALVAGILSSHLHTTPLAALVGFATLLIAIWFSILGVGIFRGQDKMIGSS